MPQNTMNKHIYVEVFHYVLPLWNETFLNSFLKRRMVWEAARGGGDGQLCGNEMRGGWRGKRRRRGGSTGKDKQPRNLWATRTWRLQLRTFLLRSLDDRPRPAPRAAHGRSTPRQVSFLSFSARHPFRPLLLRQSSPPTKKKDISVVLKVVSHFFVVVVVLLCLLRTFVIVILPS